MRNFEYVKPSTLREAIDLLDQHGPKAHIFAGGTDILVKMKQNLLQPEVLIDIKGISSLKGINYEKGKGIRIGSLTTIRDIEKSQVVREHLPVLAYAAHLLGSVQVRNRATIGGNLCNALPSADMAPYLIGMKSVVWVVGPRGERTVPLEEFFVDSGRSSLQFSEVVTAIEIPAWSEFTGGAYIKHAVKNAVDVAIVSVAAVVVTNLHKRILEDVRIVLGAVGPTPIRAKKAEDLLTGRPSDDKVIWKAGEFASEEARPRTSIEYKLDMVKVLTRKAIRQALDSIPKR